MGKRIKIWFHSARSSDIREFSIPQYLLWSFALLFLASLPVLSWVGYDYYQLKGMAYDNTSLAKGLAAKETEIESQRMQIQSFAKSIESLKSQVKVLSDLEDRVRLIADIQKKGDQSGLIGIGGIPLNDLDPDLPLEAKHNSLMREMHSQVNQTILAAKNQKTDFNSLISQLEKKKNLLAATPSIRPVDGWITSKFGYRKSPFTGQRSFHSGLDIANQTGTEIIATANGKVSYAARKMYFGNLIIIDHGFGKVTKYGHLKKILVKQGQTVKRGDVIALLGNTGQSTGPHVHYEVVVNGLPIDPLKYILN